MTGTFEHRIVYHGKAALEAKRCSVCGSPPDIEWMDMSPFQTGRMVARRVACPNGPHVMTEDEYWATQDAPPIYSEREAPPDPGLTVFGTRPRPRPRRRWWQR